MKRLFRVMALLLALMIPAGAVADEVIEVKDEVLHEDFRGFGIQWDPHAETLVYERQWDTLIKRVDYLSPALVRCMVLSRWYIERVEGDEPVLNFDNYQMRQAMKVLDYCQAHEIEVVWGDWGPPTNRGLAFDDLAWARAMAQAIAFLRQEKGYTCIRYVNIGNEPDGSWSDCGSFPVYARAVKQLHSELSALGLENDVMISGPDVYGDWNWLDLAADQLNEQLGSFDFHWYPNAINVMTGNLEYRLSSKLRRMQEKIGDRDVLVCELGLADGKNSKDQQPNVRTYWYGVSMADALVQLARGGADGVIAWDLEDSMHPSGSEYKTWGFYNMKGGEEEQALRPWFYPYALLCRLFPQGCDLLETECSIRNGVRVLAMQNEAGQMSVAVVNNSGDPVACTLRWDAMGEGGSVLQYTYCEKDRLCDENGFPVHDRVWTSADVALGIPVSLPEDGVVFFTTIQ